MDKLVALGLVLHDPLSVRLLTSARLGRICRCEIDHAFRGIPRTRIDARLSKMRDLGILDGERYEHWLYYEIDEEWRPLLREIFDFFGDSIKWDPEVTASLTRLKASRESKLFACYR